MAANAKRSDTRPARQRYTSERRWAENKGRKLARHIKRYGMHSVTSLVLRRVTDERLPDILGVDRVAVAVLKSCGSPKKFGLPSNI